MIHNWTVRAPIGLKKEYFLIILINIIIQRGGRTSPWGNYELLNSRMFSLKQHNTNHNIKYKLEIWNHIQT